MQVGTVPSASIEIRFRTLLIIWGSILSSVGLFFLLSFMADSESTGEAGILPWITLALSVTMVLLSFVVKARLLRSAEQKQDLNSVGSAYTVAFAMCEAAALFGLATRFIAGPVPVVYAMFGLAVAGLIANIPRKEHILAATYRQTQKPAI
jgi:hypothetical protein